MNLTDLEKKNIYMNKLYYITKCQVWRIELF